MWLDKVAIENIIKIRDRFGIKCFLETGTAEGNNAIFWAQHFQWVFSCDVDQELLERANRRGRHLGNVFFCYSPSPVFIRGFLSQYERDNRTDPLLFFLDAHEPGNWPILDELRSLRGLRSCCIVIHDFKVAGLGHISYGGQALDFDYIAKEIFRVNPDFHFYHNSAEKAEIWTIEEAQSGKIPGLECDDELLERLRYTWSSSWRTYRGILYAVPELLDTSFRLVKMEL